MLVWTKGPESFETVIEIYLPVRPVRTKFRETFLFPVDFCLGRSIFTAHKSRTIETSKIIETVSRY